MTDKQKIEKLEPIASEKYENVDLDHLVMYAVSQLEKIGADLSFENCVVAVFKLFPDKFSLLGFQSYPDSLRAYTCLWRCSTDKKKLWLGGKIRQGFTITDRSRTFIKEAEDMLCIESLGKTKAHSRTRRKEFLLTEVTASPAYIKFKEGKLDSISEGDLCYLLQGTLDSLPEMLKQNLASLKKYVEELEHRDLLKFFEWLENRFEKFLNGK